MSMPGKVFSSDPLLHDKEAFGCALIATDAHTNGKCGVNESRVHCFNAKRM
jgi:hypothetical protein